MAQVDFSNAVLDGNASHSANLLSLEHYIGLYDRNYTDLYDSTSSVITSNANKSIVTDTPSKASILYTGNFTASGTELYIASRRSDLPGIVWDIVWKVSNISFSSGDTYSFIIDIETSGNT